MTLPPIHRVAAICGAMLLCCAPASAQDITTGLQLHAAFEDDDLDSSGNGRNGTPSGSPTFVDGPVGRARAFASASSQHVSFGTSVGIPDAATAFTLTYWAKFTTLSDFMPQAGKYVNNNARWMGYLGGSGVGVNNTGLHVPIGNGSPNSNGNTPASRFTTGVWYHIAIVYSGAGSTNADKLKIYINGVDQTLVFGGVAIPSTLANTTSATFYAGRINTSYMNGQLDELRLYNRALASADVAALVAEAAPVNSVAPVIAGTAVSEETLTKTDGEWDEGMLTQQWYRNATASTSGATLIGSATATTYTLTQTDVGKYVYCLETSTSGDFSASVASNFIGPIADDPPETIYVRKGATGAEDGSSWEDAFTDPAAADTALEAYDTLLVSAPENDPLPAPITVSANKHGVTVDGSQGPDGEYAFVTAARYGDYSDDGGGVWSLSGITTEPSHMAYDLKQDDMAGTVTGCAITPRRLMRLAAQNVPWQWARAWYGQLVKESSPTATPAEGKWSWVSNVLYVNPPGSPDEATVNALTIYAATNVNGVLVDQCDNVTVKGIAAHYTPNIGSGSGSGYGVKIQHTIDSEIRNCRSSLGGYHNIGITGDSFEDIYIHDCFANSCNGDGSGVTNAYVITQDATSTVWRNGGSGNVSVMNPPFGYVQAGKAPPLMTNWVANHYLSHSDGGETENNGTEWSDGYGLDFTAEIEAFHSVTNNYGIAPFAISHLNGTVGDGWIGSTYPCQATNMIFEGRAVCWPTVAYYNCVNDRSGELSNNQPYIDAGGSAINYYFEGGTIITGGAERSNGTAANMIDRIPAASKVTLKNTRVLLQIGTGQALFGINSSAQANEVVRMEGNRISSSGLGSHYILRSTTNENAWNDNFSDVLSRGGNFFDSTLAGFAINNAGNSTQDFSWGRTNIAGASQDFQVDFGWGADNEERTAAMLDRAARLREAVTTEAVISNSNQVIR